MSPPIYTHTHTHSCHLPLWSVIFRGQSVIHFACSHTVNSVSTGFKPKDLGDLLNGVASAVVTVSTSRAGCACHPHYSPRLSLAWQPGRCIGREEGRGIIAEAAPSVSQLTFPLKLFIYNTEWMGGGQGKLAVNRHCQHCCLSATGNWQLYFCSYGFHSPVSLLHSAHILSSFLSLSSIICLFSLVNSCSNMPHTLFWQPSFASLTHTQTCWLILASDESIWSIYVN